MVPILSVAWDEDRQGLGRNTGRNIAVNQWPLAEFIVTKSFQGALPA